MSFQVASMGEPTCETTQPNLMLKTLQEGLATEEHSTRQRININNELF